MLGESFQPEGTTTVCHKFKKKKVYALGYNRKDNQVKVFVYTL